MCWRCLFSDTAPKEVEAGGTLQKFQGFLMLRVPQCHNDPRSELFLEIELVELVESVESVAKVVTPVERQGNCFESVDLGPDLFGWSLRNADTELDQDTDHISDDFEG